MEAAFPRDPTNGLLVGPDGGHYETAHKVYHFGVLGMCGCGNPEEAYNLVRDVLAACDRRGCHDNPPTRAWVNIESEIEKLILTKPELTAHVLLHFLTKCDVIEHGGSVGGSWLTAMGERIVDAGPQPEEED